MNRENYGMMNQEIQDDEVTIDLMELLYSCVKVSAMAERKLKERETEDKIEK